MSAEPEVLETRVEETAKLELVRRGEALEVRVDGCCVMRSAVPCREQTPSVGEHSLFAPKTRTRGRSR